ncbi:hypothetical protein D3C86_1955090 [compost metagenome]
MGMPSTVMPPSRSGRGSISEKTNRRRSATSMLVNDLSAVFIVPMMYTFLGTLNDLLE